MAVPLSKLLDPSDYDDPDLRATQDRLDQRAEALEAHGLLDTLLHRHRRWEYGLGLLAARAVDNLTSVCEVGGGTSLFLPTLAGLYPHAELVAVERDINKDRQFKQVLSVGGRILFQTEELPDRQFSFVVAISVVEHIFKGDRYIARLMDHVEPGGLLFVTTDIIPKQPDDYEYHDMRAQAWTPDEWGELARTLILTATAAGQKWEILPRDPDFTNVAPTAVYDDYTFGSLALRRVR